MIFPLIPFLAYEADESDGCSKFSYLHIALLLEIIGI